MGDLSAYELLKLIFVSRVSDKNPNTSSLLSELRISSLVSSSMRVLLEKGYLIEELINHPLYKWKLLVSEKGWQAVAEANVPAIVMDVFETARLSDVTGVIFNMSEGELCELLAHRDSLLRNWAGQRLNTLLGVEE